MKFHLTIISCVFVRLGAAEELIEICLAEGKVVEALNLGNFNYIKHRHKASEDLLNIVAGSEKNGLFLYLKDRMEDMGSKIT